MCVDKEVIYLQIKVFASWNYQTFSFYTWNLYYIVC